MFDKFAVLDHAPTNMPQKQTEGLVPFQRNPEPVKSQHIDRFIPKIKVKLENGDSLVIPADADANRNQSILLADFAREFVKKKMEQLLEADTPLTPAEMKDMMLAVSKANETCIVAYESVLPPQEAPHKAGSTATGLLLKGVEAMGRGITKGNADAQREAMEKFIKLGKDVKQADVIEVKTDTK